MISKRNHSKTNIKWNQTKSLKSANIQLSLPMRRRITSEAAALGLTSAEYMRLLLSLSSAFRQHVFTDNKMDAKAILQLVESPWFGVMMQWVASSINTSMQNDETSDKPTIADVPQGTPKITPNSEPGRQPFPYHPAQQRPQQQMMPPWGQPYPLQRPVPMYPSVPQQQPQQSASPQSGQTPPRPMNWNRY